MCVINLEALVRVPDVMTIVGDLLRNWVEHSYVGGRSTQEQQSHSAMSGRVPGDVERVALGHLRLRSVNSPQVK